MIEDGRPGYGEEEPTDIYASLSDLSYDGSYTGRAHDEMPHAGYRPAHLSEQRTEIFDGPLIDLSAPPRQDPPTPSPRARKSKVRTVVTVAAAGVVLAGGGVYMLVTGLDSNGTTTDLAAPVSTTYTADPIQTTDPASTVPSASPVASSASPTASASASATASATPSATKTATPTPTATATKATPTKTATVTASPVTSSPSASASPSRSATSPPTAATLSATYTFSGGVGTVKVTNPGTAAASTWTVSVAVSGGDNAVAMQSGAVTVSQSASTAVFTPTSSLSGGASMSFTFSYDGVANGCSIDGNACS